MLLSKDYKRCYSTNVRHYAGFKVTIAMEQRTSKPLAILMYRGCQMIVKYSMICFLNFKEDEY